MTSYLWLLSILSLVSVTLQQDPNAPGEEESALPLVPETPHTPGPAKPWTGYRAQANSTQKVVYCRKNVVVAEYDGQGTLINCEQLSVTTNEDRDAALASLKSIPTQTEVDSPTLLALMEQCRPLPTPAEFQNNEITKLVNPIATLESGGTIIAPGTKWCGGGDYGKTYYDVGLKKSVDKCCRNHDHCPTSITAFKKQFNVTNLSEATILDCACDKALYDCLKATKTEYGDKIGDLYFNVLSDPCLKVEGNTAVKTPNPLKY